MNPSLENKQTNEKHLILARREMSCMFNYLEVLTKSAKYAYYTLSSAHELVTSGSQVP